MARPKGSLNYSPEIFDQSLLALTYARRAKEAHDQLVLTYGDAAPPVDTLRRWQRENSARIAELTKEHAPQMEQLLVSRYQDIINRGADTLLKAVEKADEALEANKIYERELASFSLSLAKTISTIQDKKFLVEGKPTQIVGRDPGEKSLEALAKKYAAPIDATEAKELTEGESDE